VLRRGRTARRAEPGPGDAAADRDPDGSDRSIPATPDAAEPDLPGHIPDAHAPDRPSPDPDAGEVLDGPMSPDGPEAVDAAAVPAATSWEWENPLPQGNAILGMWGSSAEDVWAVGERGLLLHFDGRTWTRQDAGVQTHLRDIWGRAGDDVYVAMETHELLHFDGTRWSTVSTGFSGSIRALSGGPGGEIFAAGGDRRGHAAELRWLHTGHGRVRPVDLGGRSRPGRGRRLPHRPPLQWRPLERDPLAEGFGAYWDIWGSGPDDLYVIGRGLGTGTASAGGSSTPGCPPPA
jgi:hypothetical protein